MSQYLRSHNGSSFKWKDYSPLVFQRLRQLFGIDNMDYMLSLTGDRYALPLHSALPCSQLGYTVAHVSCTGNCVYDMKVLLCIHSCSHPFLQSLIHASIHACMHSF